MVMFRDFTQRKASALGLAGFVRNNNDGSVTVVAEGERSVLEQLIEKLRKGSLLSRVDNAEVIWREATNEFKNFNIHY